jgi:hypothetical protein
MPKFKTLAAFLVTALLAPLGVLAGSPSQDATGVSSDQPSLYGMQFAKAARAKASMSDVMDKTVSLFDNSKMFVQVYTGYDYSFMGDVATGTDGWISAAKSEGFTTTGGGEHSGILASLLWGLRLDKANSLALDFGSVVNFGNNWTASNGLISDTQSLSPYLFSASIDYRVDVAKSKGSRTYITAGAGWYHGIADIKSMVGGDVESGSFTGDTIGGTLGVGEEVELGGSFGLDLSVRGRYANFSKVSADSLTVDGTSQPGPFSLATGTLDGYKVIIPATNAEIDSSGGTANYASLDFSGIDAKVALNLYF